MRAAIHQPHVPRNREHPRSDRQVRSIGATRPMNLEEGLLQEILRMRAIAHSAIKYASSGDARTVYRPRTRGAIPPGTPS